MPHLLSTPAVPASIDVAFWFLEKARAADGHLPAQKLQNLLYLASVAYEREHDGAALIPASFVRNELSVVEPNLYRLLEDGRPAIRGEAPPPPVQQFLKGIWSRYAHRQVAHLNDLVQRLLAADGRVEHTTPVADRAKDVGVSESPSGSETVRTTHFGRRVSVAPWRPPVSKKSS